MSLQDDYFKEAKRSAFVASRMNGLGRTDQKQRWLVRARRFLSLAVATHPCLESDPWNMVRWIDAIDNDDHVQYTHVGMGPSPSPVAEAKSSAPIVRRRTEAAPPRQDPKTCAHEDVSDGATALWCNSCGAKGVLNPPAFRGRGDVLFAWFDGETLVGIEAKREKKRSKR